MNNLPLMYCLDATARQYYQDVTLETAERGAAYVEAQREAGAYLREDAVAEGIYQDAGGNIHALQCVYRPEAPYRCWYGAPARVIGYATGATPAEAIEAAKAKC